MATSALRQFNDAETRRLAAAEKDLATARAEIERLTREVEEGRREVAAAHAEMLYYGRGGRHTTGCDAVDNHGPCDCVARLHAIATRPAQAALTRLLAEAEARGMERAAEWLCTNEPAQAYADACGGTEYTCAAAVLEQKARALRTPTDTTPRGSGEEKA
jgi:hypothetical protein